MLSKYYITSSKKNTFKSMIEAVQEEKWSKFKDMLLEDLFDKFLDSIKVNSMNSYRGYKSSIEQLKKLGILMPCMKLNQYCLSVCPQKTLKLIRERLCGSESTKRARCSCFISFTKWLNWYTGGCTEIATPNKGAFATFPKINEDIKTPSLSHDELKKFFVAAEENNNPKILLIALLQLQGARRISEVISLKIENILWSENAMNFHVNKTTWKKAKVFCGEREMLLLKQLIGDRSSGFVFVDKNGSPIKDQNVRGHYSRIAVKAGIDNFSSHSLRRTTISFFYKLGYSTYQAAIVSRQSHATVEKYNACEDDLNPTKSVNVLEMIQDISTEKPSKNHRLCVHCGKYTT